MNKSDSQTADLASALAAGDRAALARAITLVESSAPQHRAAANELLTHAMRRPSQAIRIGVTGPPGAGKSSFIDRLGAVLIAGGRRVAALVIDPSSSLSGGSILGDKTRMERLSRDERAFIRPSPARGELGGVAGATREAVILCEAAGYDVVIIETVGAGQNEIATRGLVDFLLLLLMPGAGDELQGIKKGVMEIADAVVVNKADGDSLAGAEATRSQYQRALRFVAPATSGWTTPALTASAATGAGIAEIWALIEAFAAETKKSGVFEERRREQRRAWLHNALEAELRRYFRDHPAWRGTIPELETAVVAGELPAPLAAARLLESVLPALGGTGNRPGSSV